MSIKEFADKYIKAQVEAWQKGDFNALQALEDPNVVYHLSLVGQDLVGWEAHKQDILLSREAGSNRRQEWNYLTGEGNLFALSYKSCFISTGKWIIPTGKEVTGNAMILLRLENGKIVEGW